MKCTIPGCRNRYLARGMCVKHWNQWNRAGRPGNPPRLIAKAGFGKFQKRHPLKRTKNGRIDIHRLKAESVLGKKLPPKAVVHHHYGNPDTLVICPSQTYHMLIEQRTKHDSL